MVNRRYSGYSKDAPGDCRYRGRLRYERRPTGEVMIDRRSVISGGATALAFTGLGRLLSGCASASAPTALGELTADPAGIIDLPPGFTYRVLSRVGEPMSDGLVTPGRPDGMAAFAVDGRVVLIRNHELGRDDGERAWGAALPGDPAFREAMFDAAVSQGGGTSTLVLDPRSLRVERSYLSLAGTSRNCAGGPTPWQSWLTCEEPGVGAGLQPGHGYVFEVPARIGGGIERAVPLRAMGRFNHEACAVDPQTGAVYMTEDRPDGLFYRFLPRERRRLAVGGRLQALAIADQPGADTARLFAPGQTAAVRWIDLDDVDPAEDNLRRRGHEAGAARFVRGEGLWRGLSGEIWFTCTQGGAARKGQIWRYWPRGDTGMLELFVEPNEETVMDLPDNITVAPWGELVICEDGPGENYIRMVSPDGRVRPFGRHRASDSEFAGACFAPDGRTLFVNIQEQGLTLAIRGPWPRA